MDNFKSKFQDKLADIIMGSPFPFEVEANDKSNKEDVKMAKIMKDLLEWDWKHGGNVRFFRESERVWVRKLLDNLPAKPKSVKRFNKKVANNN